MNPITIFLTIMVALAGGYFLGQQQIGIAVVLFIFAAVIFFPLFFSAFFFFAF